MQTAFDGSFLIFRFLLRQRHALVSSFSQFPSVGVLKLEYTYPQWYARESVWVREQVSSTLQKFSTKTGL